ncbi:MAG: PEGA domain-containing protein [Planctomycetes bacterium]|nr:PEGA domain-containing protein [Planctomycetota bacterium]
MKRFCHLGLLTLLLASGGCVERTMKIETDPPGALVVINDEEVGVSPVRFSFLWYGDYDIILRKPGYETLKTHHRLAPPWYQLPPFDLVAETMVLGTIHDDRVLPVFNLKQAPSPPLDEVVRRAVELRGRALYEGG